jgi:hypothetical protein
MQTRDLKLLLELGILDPRADEFTAYVLWADFCKDPVVHTRSREAGSGTFGTPGTPSDVHVVYAAMSTQEKQELYERLYAKAEATNRAKVGRLS